MTSESKVTQTGLPNQTGMFPSSPSHTRPADSAANPVAGSPFTTTYVHAYSANVYRIAARDRATRQREASAQHCIQRLGIHVCMYVCSPSTRDASAPHAQSSSPCSSNLATSSIHPSIHPSIHINVTRLDPPSRRRRSAHHRTTPSHLHLTPCDAPNPPFGSPPPPTPVSPAVKKPLLASRMASNTCTYPRRTTSPPTVRRWPFPSTEPLPRARLFFSFFHRYPAGAFEIPIVEPRADGGCLFGGGVQRGGEGVGTEVGVGSWEWESWVGGGMGCM